MKNTNKEDVKSSKNEKKKKLLVLFLVFYCYL